MSVEARVESLVAVLQDNSEHWKPRLAALEELHDIAERARPTPDDLSKEVFAMLRGWIIRWRKSHNRSLLDGMYYIIALDPFRN